MAVLEELHTPSRSAIVHAVSKKALLLEEPINETDAAMKKKEQLESVKSNVEGMVQLLCSKLSEIQQNLHDLNDVNEGMFLAKKIHAIKEVVINEKTDMVPSIVRSQGTQQLPEEEKQTQLLLLKKILEGSIDSIVSRISELNNEIRILDSVGNASRIATMMTITQKIMIQ